MPRKPITWIGSIIVLAAGVFCFWALMQRRSEMLAAGMPTDLITVALFFAPVFAALAIILLYYFVERQ